MGRGGGSCRAWGEWGPGLGVSGSGLWGRHPLSPTLGAATAIHHHARDLAVDNLLLVIEVEHVDWGHLGGGTAGPSRASWVGLLHQMGVRILLHEHVLALARAVVGLVALRCDDPVPAESLKVHREGVSAAAGLTGVLITVQAQVPPGPFCVL